MALNVIAIIGIQTHSDSICSINVYRIFIYRLFNDIVYHVYNITTYAIPESYTIEIAITSEYAKKPSHIKTNNAQLQPHLILKDDHPSQCSLKSLKLHNSEGGLESV